MPRTRHLPKSALGLMLLLGGCNQPASQPTGGGAKGTPGDAAQNSIQMVPLQDFGRIAKDVVSEEQEAFIQAVFVTGGVPEIRLKTTWKYKEKEQTLFSSLLPLPVDTGVSSQPASGYLVLSVPNFAPENRDRQLRLTWYPLGTSARQDKQEPSTIAVPLGSILPDEKIYAMKAERMSDACFTTRFGEEIVSVNAGVSLMLADDAKEKGSLNFTVVASKMPVRKPISEQAAELTTGDSFYRGFGYTFVDSAEGGGIDVPLDDFQPRGHIRYTTSGTGTRWEITPIRGQVVSETVEPGIEIKPVQLASDRITFEVVARLDGQIVQADLLEVPVDQTEVFWVQPSVAFFREQGKPPVGIAVHVFSEE
ncbi:MAG: hypothetical protein H8E44_27215 [Planctomycetes bacterium]|nr:hypothetical protein [Planctomycetota bacterium]MBL7037460.1 hypothetical protein [Pirellulaceae bacterium]